MKAWDIVAWTYDAGTHCNECAKLAGMDVEGAVDTEGNEPHPIFASDDLPACNEMDGILSCDTCGETIVERDE